MTDSVEQIEIMKKVDSDVENWWRSCLHLAPSHVTEIEKLSGHECFNSRSVLKETIAKLLFQLSGDSTRASTAKPYQGYAGSGSRPKK